MTTLTLNHQPGFKKTHFSDLFELRDYINRKLEAEVDVDFRPLKKSEITPALRKKMRDTKKLSASRFTNLTARHAHR